MRSVLILAAAALLLTACYDRNAQRSAIVRQVEAAGAGDLSTYTQQGLTQWFSTRPQLAQQIAAECVPIAKVAPANWLTTSEGTVCHVATNRAAWAAFDQMTTDTKGFTGDPTPVK